MSLCQQVHSLLCEKKHQYIITSTVTELCVQHYSGTGWGRSNWVCAGTEVREDFLFHETNRWKALIQCLQQSRCSINLISLGPHAPSSPSLLLEDDVSRQARRISQQTAQRCEREQAGFPEKQDSAPWMGQPTSTPPLPLPAPQSVLRSRRQWLGGLKEEWGLGPEWEYPSHSTT